MSLKNQKEQPVLIYSKNLNYIVRICPKQQKGIVNFESIYINNIDGSRKSNYVYNAVILYLR